MKNALLVISILFLSLPAHAAREKTTRTKSILRKPFYQGSFGYRIWHEDVAATSAGTEGDIPMQFHGFEFGAGYEIPFKAFRWVQYYGADLAIGVAKGIGKGPVVDELKDQSWLAFTAKAGIIYRATAVSEVGLFIPLTIRSARWKLDENAQLEMKDESFSAGLGGLFINRFTPYQALVVSLTHQHMWNSTVWGIAWQYDFK